MLTVLEEGQEIVGFWLSTTVTVKEQVSVFPAASVARQVTVVVPSEKVDPEPGPDNRVMEAPEQLSETVGVEYETTLLQEPEPALTVMDDGQEATGSMPSKTVTLKEHVATLPEASVPRKATVVVPMGKKPPEGGPAILVKEPPEQLSLKDGLG